jgi:hypothetical protein
MKFTTVFIATVAATAIGVAHAVDSNANPNAGSPATLVANPRVPDSETEAQTDMPTPDQALKSVQQLQLPSGVTLTGSTEPIQMKTTKEGKHAVTTIASDNDKHEQWGIGGGFGGGYGGWGGLGWGGGYGGGWGGWGGFGPYRFGYSCGGIGGWAYPLGFWNTFGAGIWGGGCGLGFPYGGLFYC